VTVVGITGAAGMIGWHARCLVETMPNVEGRPADRSTFAADDRLDAFVAGCDAVLHLAGQNRGDPEELAATNVRLAQQLVAALDRTGARPQLAYANSTHAGRPDSYGQSKMEAANILRSWAERVGGAFTEVVLPHVFGEGGRPYYNSVVSTFCHRLAQSEPLEVDVDRELELVHAQDAMRQVLDAVLVPGPPDILRIEGTRMTVTALREVLQDLSAGYTPTQFPSVRQGLDLRLFNTLRSYRFPGGCPIRVPAHADQRGAFVEIAKSSGEGQTSFSTTRPGITRGDHFHLRKIERFVVVEGMAEIRLRRLFDDEVVTIPVTGDEPVAVDMPTLHTHSITNVGDTELLTLFWISEIFDPADADTFPMPVVVA
jgi:UDP-2-acetamido-2,6-beta-L-arabino-hexul-4-ose reductase